MFCDCWCRDETVFTSQGSAHPRASLSILPPLLCVSGSAVLRPYRVNMLPDILERPLVQGSLLHRHKAEIYGPLSAGPTHQVYGAGNWAHYIRVGTAIDVYRSSQHLFGNGKLDI